MSYKHRVRVAVLMIGLVAAWMSLGTANAASIERFTNDCLAIHVTGHTTVATNAIRITITPASDLRRQLAESVIRVDPDSGAAFSADVPYPPQTPGTRLVVAVGEWNGTKYLVPAEMLGFDVPACAATPEAVATPGADWLTFSDPRPGFSFSYPSTWVSRGNTAGDNTVEFVLPPTNRVVLQMVVYFDGGEPMSYPCAGDMCLFDQSRIDQIFNLRWERMVTIPGSPQDSVFIRREDVMVDGERGAMIDWWNLGAEQNKNRFVFIRTAGRVYGIEGAYETEEALADWMQVISGFRWLKP